MSSAVEKATLGSGEVGGAVSGVVQGRGCWWA